MDRPLSPYPKLLGGIQIPIQTPITRPTPTNKLKEIKEE